MTFDSIIIILGFCFGLLIGSFLNVVAIRLLKGQSIVFPPSHCVHCHKRLKRWDLVPLFSYIGLRGKCRYCKHRISLVYPVGEFVTGLLFAFIVWQFGLTAELIVGLVFVSILIVAVHTDLKATLIPDKVVYFGMIVIASLRLFIHPAPFWNYAAAFIIAGGIFYLLAIVSKGGMGGGDIKLFALLGLVLGIQQTLLSIFLSCFFGVMHGLAMAIKHKKRPKGTSIPFAPSIALASIISYVWGDTMWQWYSSLLWH